MVVFYHGKKGTLKEFCKEVDFDYKEIECYVKENGVSTEDSVMHFFPKAYINVFGELVIVGGDETWENE